MRSAGERCRPPCLLLRAFFWHVRAVKMKIKNYVFVRGGGKCTAVYSTSVRLYRWSLGTGHGDGKFSRKINARLEGKKTNNITPNGRRVRRTFRKSIVKSRTVCTSHLFWFHRVYVPYILRFQKHLLSWYCIGRERAKLSFKLLIVFI